MNYKTSKKRTIQFVLAIELINGKCSRLMQNHVQCPALFIWTTAKKLLDVLVAWFLRGTDPLDGVFLFLRVQSNVSDVKCSLHSPASKPQPNPNKIHAIDKFVVIKVIFTAFESMEGCITSFFFSISRQQLHWNCYFYHQRLPAKATVAYWLLAN